MLADCFEYGSFTQEYKRKFVDRLRLHLPCVNADLHRFVRAFVAEFEESTEGFCTDKFAASLGKDLFEAELLAIATSVVNKENSKRVAVTSPLSSSTSSKKAKSELSLGGLSAGGKQALLNQSTFTNTALAPHEALFESHADVVRLQIQTWAMKGRVMCVVWTDDALPNAYLADCKITNYHKSTKVATVVYENTSDVWEGSMKLDLKMLNGGPSSGELLGRGKSRMHCRPYAIYKPRAARVGTSLGEAIAAQQEA